MVSENPCRRGCWCFGAAKMVLHCTDISVSLCMHYLYCAFGVFITSKNADSSVSLWNSNQRPVKFWETVAPTVTH